MFFIAIFLGLLILIFRFLNKELSTYKRVDMGDFLPDDTSLYEEDGMDLSSALGKIDKEPKSNDEKLIDVEGMRSISNVTDQAQVSETSDASNISVEYLGGDRLGELRNAIVWTEILKRKY